MTRRQSYSTAAACIAALAALLGWGWFHRSTQETFLVMVGTFFLFLLSFIFASGMAISPWKEAEVAQKKAHKKAARQAARNADNNPGDWGNNPHVLNGGFFD